MLIFIAQCAYTKNNKNGSSVNVGTVKLQCHYHILGTTDGAIVGPGCIYHFLARTRGKTCHFSCLFDSRSCKCEVMSHTALISIVGLHGTNIQFWGFDMSVCSCLSVSKLLFKDWCFIRIL